MTKENFEFQTQNRIAMQVLIEDIEGILNVAEEALEYEIEMHNITSVFEAQKQAHKNKMELLKSNRLALTSIYEQGIRRVRDNGVDWIDVETNVVVTGLQSLAQAKSMHPQLSLDFKKQGGLDD